MVGGSWPRAGLRRSLASASKTSRPVGLAGRPTYSPASSLGMWTRSLSLGMAFLFGGWRVAELPRYFLERRTQAKLASAAMLVVRFPR
jgi:hypothetical protein